MYNQQFALELSTSKTSLFAGTEGEACLQEESRLNHFVCARELACLWTVTAG